MADTLNKQDALIFLTKVSFSGNVLLPCKCYNQLNGTTININEAIKFDKISNLALPKDVFNNPVKLRVYKEDFINLDNPTIEDTYNYWIFEGTWKSQEFNPFSSTLSGGGSIDPSTIIIDMNQVTGLVDSLTGINEKNTTQDQSIVDNTEKINQNTTSIQNINTKLETLSGRIVMIGQDEEHNKEELLSDDGALATQFVQTKKSRNPEVGDTIVSNDYYVLVYGTEWVNIGLTGVSIASNTSAGVIKLGINDGQLESIDEDGSVKVKGWDNIISTVNSKADDSKVETIKTELTENVTQVSNNKLDKTTFNSHITTEYNSLKTKVEENTTSISNLNDSKLNKETFESHISDEFTPTKNQVNTNKTDISSIKNQLNDFVLSEDFNTTKEQVENININKADKTELEPINQNIDTLNNSVVKLSDNQTISGAKTFTNETILRDIKLGYGVPSTNNVKIAPDEQIKTLTFNDDDKIFNIDLQQKSNLTGLKEPTQNSDATTKNYVDIQLTDKVNTTEYNTTKEKVSANEQEIQTLKNNKLDKIEFTTYKEEEINPIKTKILTIEEKLEGIVSDEEVAQLKGQVNTNKTDIADIKENKLDKNIYDTFIRDDFNTTRTQVESNKSNLEEIKTNKLDSETYTSFINGDYNTTKTQVNTNKNNISSIETKIGNIEDTGVEGADIASQISKIKSSLDDLGSSEEINSIKSQIEELETNKVNTIDFESYKTETIIPISDKANNNENEINTLKQSVETTNSNMVSTSGNQTITGTKTFTNPQIFSNIHLGRGVTGSSISPVRIMPDTGKKVITFNNGTDSTIFDINLQDKSKLTGIKAPVDPSDAVRKSDLDLVSSNLGNLSSEYNNFKTNDFNPLKDTVDSLKTSNDDLLESINNKVNISDFNTVKEQSDSNKVKITQLENTVNTNTNQISDISSKISKLEGKVALIGRDENHSESELMSNSGELANQYVQEKKSREPEMGDLIISNDDYELYYDGEQWLNIGRKTVPIANTSNAGLIKLGNENGNLEDVGDGLAKVKGWEYLQGQVNSKADSSRLEELNTSIQSNTTEINNIKSQYSNKSSNESITGRWTFDEYWTLFHSISLGGSHEEEAKISPATNLPIRDLKFGTSNDNYFNLNLDERSSLTGLKEPINETDAVRKTDLDSTKDTLNNQIDDVKTNIIGDLGSSSVQGSNLVDILNKINSNMVTIGEGDTNEQIVLSRKTFQYGMTVGRNINFGFGSPTEFLFTTDNGTKKAITVDGAKILNFDFKNKSKIFNVPNPTDATDVANLESAYNTSMFARRSLPKDLVFFYDTTVMPTSNKIPVYGKYGQKISDLNFNYTVTRPEDSNVLYRIENAINNNNLLAITSGAIINSSNTDCLSIHMLLRIPTKEYSGDYGRWFPIIKGSGMTSAFGTARSGLNFNYGEGTVQVEIVGANYGDVHDFQLDTIYSVLVEYKPDKARLYLNGELNLEVDYVSSSFSQCLSSIRYGFASDGNGKRYMFDLGSICVLNRELTPNEKKNGLKYTGLDMFEI